MISASRIHAQAEVPATNLVQFSRDIAPILVRKCLACHDSAKAKGEYRVHTITALMTPGRSGEKPVVAGAPDRSLLVRLLQASDPDDRMPQKEDPLPQGQIAWFIRWIAEGARTDEIDPERSLAALVASAPQPEPPAAYPRPVPILALAFSRDGKTLAVGGYHEVTLWDAGSGQLRRRIANVAQQVQSLAFSPDDWKLLVAAGTPGRSGEVKLFLAEKGTLLQTLGTAGDLMLTATFSHDGTRAAFGGADNALQVFDLTAGTNVFRCEHHADWVFAADFSPDGRQLVTASRDKTVRVIDGASGSLEQTYAGHADPVFAAAFCADGKRVLSAGRDRKIHLWNTSEAKKLGEAGPFGAEVLALVVREQRVFSASADGEVREHRLTNNRLEPVRTYRGHHDFVRSLAVHLEDGNGRLAAGAHTGMVRIWDLASGDEVMHFFAAPGVGSTGTAGGGAD